ncbi:hypothetical protein E2C01_003396 [Portunus trituberculatus]|uniref:Ig-like domain-containing protein n=1 Tax=Portunus trituberculatus TaxID=210409 RepID=A0A5B7CQY8_PORTR|nr:hypothetical protein [Portunus trituberculatus]
MQGTSLLSVAVVVICSGTQTGGQVVLELAVASGNTEPSAGNNVTLSCRGRGDLLQWRHGHHNITPSEDRYHVEIIKEKPKAIKSNLTIMHVTLRDSGHYHCQITKTNKDKVAEDDIALHVQGNYAIRSKQESGLHLSDLLIDNVTLKDNGTYKCVASNSEGPGDRPGEPILIVQGSCGECWWWVVE